MVNFLNNLLALPRLSSHPTNASHTPGKLSSPTTHGSSNTPGPPVSLTNSLRILSQITGKEQPDAQKALQTIQTLLTRQVSIDFRYDRLLRKSLLIIK